MGNNIYPGYTEIEIAIETKSHEHIETLHKALTAIKATALKRNKLDRLFFQYTVLSLPTKSCGY